MASGSHWTSRRPCPRPRNLRSRPSRSTTRAPTRTPRWATSLFATTGIATAAQKEFERAEELDPGDLWIHEWHAHALVASGHADDAVAEAEARNLSRSHAAAMGLRDAGFYLWLARRTWPCNTRKNSCRPSPTLPGCTLSWHDSTSSREIPRPAQRNRSKLTSYSAATPKSSTNCARRSRNLARARYWRAKVAHYEKAAKSSYVSSGLVAQACIKAGDNECAFKWLEKGFEARDDIMINLNADQAIRPHSLRPALPEVGPTRRHPQPLNVALKSRSRMGGGPLRRI